MMEIKEETKDAIVFKCPYCGSGNITINKHSKHKYADCSGCGATYIHYIPLEHQLDFHKSKAKVRLCIGG